MNEEKLVNSINNAAKLGMCSIIIIKQKNEDINTDDKIRIHILKIIQKRKRQYWNQIYYIQGKVIIRIQKKKQTKRTKKWVKHG